ncbi:unnamed protein product [Candidula unifasciata]|uniref:C2H2-type domain-containing protein n=1 Tax=Candidula unifasciata TaxID=100452 RepID=A0A8S3ZJH8_9EUPU|nr:unnamed protein product [Candidula unifasciata]
MAAVFSHVEADIADDLLKRFPQEFDFDAMLRKVCEDAGVSIVDKSDARGNASTKYRLQGLWLAMEKAYKHLVTTLALYGTRLPDVFSEQNKPRIDENGYEAGDGMNDDETDKDYHPTVRNILNDIFGDGRRVRRPRKSAWQNKKVDDQDEINFEEEENDEDSLAEQPEPLVATAEPEAKKDVENVENEDGETQMVNGSENNSGTAEVENAKHSKRGRPRKNKSPFHLHVKKIVKKRGPYKNRRVVIPVKSASPNELLTSRRRGRPKVCDDEGRSDFPCPDCSFVAKKHATLRSHRLRMHLSSPTKCDVCSKVFPNKRYMLRHRASHVAPQHCCDVCGKMYKIRKAMLEHRKTHDTTYKKTKVKCEHCPKVFCNRYILECHIRDVHMGQKKSYLCSTCGKSFTTKHSLAEHTNAHTGVKPHTCEHCGKSFSYESALRDHRYTHTDDKHFWCNHCQKGFSQRSGLKMHMRIHRQHKMFICSECGRGFTQKQALQRHERVHKGEKPFVCRHCGRFFTDASIIRRHLILVHKIHKDANNWREDIVCTVKNQSEYQVQKIDEDDSVSESEKEKEEILKAVGVPTRNTKGPSRAFCRTYPRRVALLDDEGNIIAPPEMPPRPPVQRTKIHDAGSLIGQPKNLVGTAATNTSLILVGENSSDMDSNSQVLGQRYVEAPQWDTLTGHLTRAATTHIEHVILDDTAQHEIQRGIEHVQNLPKIVKYEALQPDTVISSNSHSILSHAQTSQSPSSSPLSFAVQPASHARALEASFESLNPQAAHSGNQYYDGRSAGHAGTSWSSMFYYTQLASQFGMSINPEYPCVGGTSPSVTSTGHLTQYATHLTSNHQSSPTTLILQSQPHNIHLDSSKPDEHRNQSHPTQNTLHSTSGLTLSVAASHGLKLEMATDAESLHHADFLPHHSPTHTLSTADSHHVTTVEHLTSTLGDPQDMMARSMGIQITASRQSPPDIPSRNSMMHSLKHK